MNQRAAAYDDALLMHSRMENCLDDTLYIGGVIEVDNRERGRGDEGWMRWRDGGISYYYCVLWECPSLFVVVRKIVKFCSCVCERERKRGKE